MDFQQTKVKAKKFGKKLMLFLIFGLIIFSVVYYFYRTYTVSEGIRSGNMFKISEKGYVFKTFEGELHLGGSQMMTKSSIWAFSVKDRATYQEMQKYEGKNVKVHYKQLIDPFAWQGETEYLVYKVEAVE
jgi:flagellar basal body-associated protein FliL